MKQIKNHRSPFVAPGFACILNLLAIFLPACNQSELGVKQQHSATDPGTSNRILKSEQQLHNGDIVLRSGRDLISNLFAQLNQTDKTFSHCGIVFLESNGWVVYHSIGGEDNPNEKLRRDSFRNFVSPLHNSGYAVCRYSLDSLQCCRLKNVVDSMYRKQVPFDMNFDLKSDDRLYCAEMVYKAFNKACSCDSCFKTSMHKGFEYISTDNILLNNKSRILCHIVY